MKSLKNSAYLPLALLVFFLSCGTDNLPISPETSELSVIMPLKIGNKWIYENTIFDSTGATVRSLGDTLEIISEIIIDGQKWFVTNENCLVRNSSEGLCSALLENGEIHNASLALKFPGSTGDKWYYDYSTIVSSDMSIKVRYGEFHCFKYEAEMNLEDTPSITYAAPGIGILRAECYCETADGNKYMYAAMELKDAVLK